VGIKNSRATATANIYADAQSPSYEYQVGRNLPLNAPSYVRHQADLELLKKLDFNPLSTANH